MLVVALAAACGGGDDAPGGDSDAAAPGADASGEVCDGAGPLTFGACVRADDSPCVSVADADARFLSLAPNDTVDLVVGFQGATMMALAVRADGIAPGTTASDYPRVDVGLDNADGERIASFFNGVPFEAVDGDTFEWLFVFLIVPGAGGELTGQILTASGSVVDTNGEARCGSVDVVAGEL